MSKLARLGQRLLASPHESAGWTLLFAAAPWVQLPIGWMAMVIVGLRVLGSGWSDAWPCVIAAQLPGLVASLWLGQDYLLLSIPGWVTGWVALALMRHFRCWGMVVEGLALVGVVLVASVHGLHPNLQVFWAERLTALTQAMLTGARADGKAVLDAVALMSQLATGVQVTSASLFCLPTLALARRWLLVAKPAAKARYHQAHFEHVRISITLLGLLGAVVLAAFVGGWPLAVDALPVVAWPLLIAGISVIGYALPKAPERRVLPWLGLAMACVFWIPYGIFSMMALGLLDSPMDFRQKIDRLKSKVESD